MGGFALVHLIALAFYAPHSRWSQPSQSHQLPSTREGMIFGLASEWIGEHVGGPERYATNLIRHVVRVDTDNRFVVFLTPRGARGLCDLADSRVSLRSTPVNSRWYYVRFGFPLAGMS